MKVKFFTDFEKDLQIIRHDYPQIRKIMNNDFVKLLNFYYPECKNFSQLHIVKFFKENKLSIMRKIKKSSKKLIKKWRSVEKEYFEKINKISPWQEEEYFCHLSSSYICGGGYSYPRTIIVFPLSRHVNPLFTIIHELGHLHVMSDSIKLRIEIPKKKQQEFYEIATNLLLSKIRLNKLKIYTAFPNKKIETDFNRISKKIEQMDLSWYQTLLFLPDKLK
jgi:ribosomal protein L44E